MPRVLLIDDDDAMRKLLRCRLEPQYEILDTSDPEEGIVMALQHKPDAILLDLMMPRYSGFEVCQTLSSMSFTDRIAIFIVTGESGERYRQFCKNMGARGFFQKPVDFAALNGQLRAAMEAGKAAEHPEPRVRMRVVLRIRGLDSKGSPLEITTVTESATPNGFVCACPADMKEGASVEVSLAADGQPFGKARVSRVDWPGTAAQTCEFQFLGKPVAWVLR